MTDFFLPKIFSGPLFSRVPLPPDTPLTPRTIDGVLVDEWLQIILIANLVVDSAGCWIWHGRRSPDEYGILSVGIRRLSIHRVAYTLWREPIPIGLTIDHLCRTHPCANPWHMEAVPNAENVLRGESIWAQNKRKTVCVNGHPFTEDNIIRVRHPNGKQSRQCRTCQKEYQRKHRIEKKHQATRGKEDSS
jgi:hypothetical protein